MRINSTGREAAKSACVALLRGRLADIHSRPSFPRTTPDSDKTRGMKRRGPIKRKSTISTIEYTYNYVAVWCSSHGLGPEYTTRMHCRQVDTICKCQGGWRNKWGGIFVPQRRGRKDRVRCPRTTSFSRAKAKTASTARPVNFSAVSFVRWKWT